MVMPVGAVTLVRLEEPANAARNILFVVPPGDTLDASGEVFVALEAALFINVLKSAFSSSKNTPEAPVALVDALTDVSVPSLFFV